MGIEVAVGTEENLKNAAGKMPDFRTMEEAAAYIRGFLDSAKKKGEEPAVLYYTAPGGKPSEQFSSINRFEKPIVEYLRTHDAPKTVRIVCDSEETARFCKVVYNMYYADSKEERIEDAQWD
ncbi:MAG: hypothetical protein IJJ52_02140 [Lachnospiraceae bacterium]|nr:hypothetical protein [Lachnospiraceae bacterium]